MGVKYVKRNLIGPEVAGVTPYPEAHHVNNGDECERWFYANGNGQVLIREYVQRAIPAAGISLGVTYQRNVSRAGFLVVYACANLHSEYNRAIIAFNLQRLKWTLGENSTFILLVETTPNSTETYSDADVIVHADFISPNSFYDAAAFQEGILEAFRLLGRNLVGFAALIILNDSIVGPWVNSEFESRAGHIRYAHFDRVSCVAERVCVRQWIDLQSGRIRVSSVCGILAIRPLSLWKMERHVDLRRLHGAVLDAFDA